MKLSLLLLLPAVFLGATGLRAQDSDPKAEQLARDVWKASGGENWSKVKRLRFTFIVEQEGKQLASVKHDWDLAAQTDHVIWKGKDKDYDVTVNLATPPQEGDGKAAYGRWVNDSYWLLAPLKVLDVGVKRAYEGPKEVNGANYETLRLTFQQVGLTPSDQYVLYIDPATKLVAAWDYIPQSGEMTHGTWEGYREFSGLQLATEHNFAGKMIRLADIEVVAQ